MDHDGWMHSDMAGWAEGGWHWLFGLHGVFSVLFLAIIVFALVVLFRDWRRDHDDYSSKSRTGATDNHVGSSQ